MTGSCSKLNKEWAEQQYVEPPIDWTKVAVDTPILVSGDNKLWCKRYFAEFKDGEVYTWTFGATSWSADNERKSFWEYAKLVEQENK